MEWIALDQEALDSVWRIDVVETEIRCNRHVNEIMGTQPLVGLFRGAVADNVSCRRYSRITMEATASLFPLARLLLQSRAAAKAVQQKRNNVMVDSIPSVNQGRWWSTYWDIVAILQSLG